MGNTTESVRSLYDIFIEKFGPEVKPREGNNIRQTCPKCLHKSLSCNVHTGQIHCFQCTYGKGLKFTGDSSGVPESPVNFDLHLKVSKRILELTTLFPDHKKYLVERGIYSPEDFSIKSVTLTLERSLLQEFSKQELVDSGYFYNSPSSGLMASKAIQYRRILIPFWSGGELIGLKSRINPFVDVLEEDKRYICPRGSKVRSKLWYQLPLQNHVIVTEGELAAIAAISCGFSAIGIPGISQVNSPELVKELKSLTEKCTRVYIILDTDVGIKTDKMKLQHALQLYEKIPNSCIVYLPQDSPTEKMDLDLFLCRYGDRELQDILDDRWPLRQALARGLRKRIATL